MEQNITEGKNKACFQMAQDLVSNRRCLSDHEKSAEVHWDRYQAWQHNEKLQMK
jgi:hypothetical protein